jgi:hypothetical protein
VALGLLVKRNDLHFQEAGERRKRENIADTDIPLEVV